MGSNPTFPTMSKRNLSRPERRQSVIDWVKQTNTHDVGSKVYRLENDLSRTRNRLRKKDDQIHQLLQKLEEIESHNMVL